MFPDPRSMNAAGQLNSCLLRPFSFSDEKKKISFYSLSLMMAVAAAARVNTLNISHQTPPSNRNTKVHRNAQLIYIDIPCGPVNPESKINDQSSAANVRWQMAKAIFGIQKIERNNNKFIRSLIECESVDSTVSYARAPSDGWRGGELSEQLSTSFNQLNSPNE